MMPELTPDLKERLFMQYYMQNLMWFAGYEEEMGVFIVSGRATGESIDSAYLGLRSVSNITDEEAIEIAKIVRPKHQYLHTPEEGKWYILRERTTSPKEYLQLTDYLRSIGVALPFMGYSVEELVEAGWVKMVAEEVAQS